MTFYYDAFGNLTQNVDPLRSTEIVPPECAAGMQPNWQGHGWACVSYVAPPAPRAPFLGTKISPRAFFNRFGANLTWLYTEAQTNVMLQIYKDKVLSEAYVDLADPETAADLATLLTLPQTPFTAAINTAILTAPVQASELPKSQVR